MVTEEEENGPTELSSLCQTVIEVPFKPPVVEKVLTFPPGTIPPVPIIEIDKPIKPAPPSSAPWFPDLEARQNAFLKHAFGLYKLDLNGSTSGQVSFQAAGSMKIEDGETAGSFSGKYNFVGVPGLSITERWRAQNIVGAELAYDELYDLFGVSIDGEYPLSEGEDKAVVSGAARYRNPFIAGQVAGNSNKDASVSGVIGVAPFFLGGSYSKSGEDEPEKRVTAALIGSTWSVATYWGHGANESEEKEVVTSTGASLVKSFISGWENFLALWKEEGKDGVNWTVGTGLEIPEVLTGRVTYCSDHFMKFSIKAFILPQVALTLGLKMNMEDEGDGEMAAGINFDFK